MGLCVNVGKKEKGQISRGPPSQPIISNKQAITQPFPPSPSPVTNKLAITHSQEAPLVVVKKALEDEAPAEEVHEVAVAADKATFVIQEAIASADQGVTGLMSVINVYIIIVPIYAKYDVSYNQNHALSNFTIVIHMLILY